MNRLYLFLGIVLLTGLVILYYTSRARDRNEPPLQVKPVEVPSTPKPSVKTNHSTPKSDPLSSKEEKSAFQVQLDTTFRALPTKEDVRRQPLKGGELFSPAVLTGGRLLGTVVQSLRENPAHIPQALPFFKTCAQDDRLATAIRASCLRKLKDFAKESPTPYDVRNDDFPQRIVRISERLPKTK